MKYHKDLEVWKTAMRLAAAIYQFTETFPKHELYGLTSQLRRAAVSIASNIAEGAARQSKQEFIQFLYYSLGSVAEVETQIELAQMLNYSTPDALPSLLDLRESVAKMLYGLIRSLKE